MALHFKAYYYETQNKKVLPISVGAKSVFLPLVIISSTICCSCQMSSKCHEFMAYLQIKYVFLYVTECMQYKSE